jgi:hypothetical protein
MNNEQHFEWSLTDNGKGLFLLKLTDEEGSESITVTEEQLESLKKLLTTATPKVFKDLK